MPSASSRRGRPRVPEHKKRTELLGTRVTIREAELVHEMARTERMPVSDLLRLWCRQRILQSFHSSISSTV